MISPKIYKNACRICLKGKVRLNWNKEIFDFSSFTYKDCYYKLTQLEENDSFSSLLCKKCSTDLKNAHLLCEKALDSNKILMDTQASDNQIVTEFKEKNSNFSNFDCLNNKDDVVEISQGGSKSNEMLEIKTITESKSVDVKKEEENAMDINVDWSIQEDELNIKVEDCTEIFNSDSSLTSCTQEQKLIPNTLDDVNEKCSDIKSNAPEKSKAGVGIRKRKIMCSYCSQTVPDIYALRQHEATHNENRPRTETCPDCGLKLYTRRALYTHLEIHAENRTRNHQCEFCDKAYFTRGSLNIHRRIHLGQMVECRICKREFYRQVDLDKHLLKHSAARIQKDVKKKKYLVHCKECNNEISVKNWKAHKASHLSEPQMKCKICNREFYSRGSCSRHLKIVHKKTRAEYDSFIHYYVEKTNMRISHLMLEQQERVQSAIE